MVRAFSNILAHHILQLARHCIAADRTALPVAGDNAGAKASVAGLIDRLCFDTVDAGSLAKSWRFEPEAAAYIRLYLADPSAPGETNARRPATPVGASTLRSPVKEATRVRVVERTF